MRPGREAPTDAVVATDTASTDAGCYDGAAFHGMPPFRRCDVHAGRRLVRVVGSAMKWCVGADPGTLWSRPCCRTLYRAYANTGYFK